MKKLVLITILAISAEVSLTQDVAAPFQKRPLNSTGVGFFGDASVISFRYERLFLINQKVFLAGELGIGYNEAMQLCIFGPCSEPAEKYLTLPHHLTANLGRSRHLFEIGLGATYLKGDTYKSYLLYPIIGYRIQPLLINKIKFRVYGSYPFSGLENEDYLYSPVGISLGIVF